MSALEILRSWEWRRCDPDGFPFHPGKDLNSVANRLAMEGVRRPQDAILALLCQGVLTARGSYKWRKYQDCDHFQAEVECEPIKVRHWKRLAHSIEESEQIWGFFSRKGSSLKLPEIGFEQCLSYEWEYDSCAFRYATATANLAPFDDDYLEEWFSAWDINVWPNDLEAIIWDDEPQPETVPPMPSVNKGGRPPAADWELAALEISGRYYRGDFKPQTIADVGRELALWLSNQDSHPSDSVVRIHAKRIFDAFQAWEQE